MRVFRWLTSRRENGSKLGPWRERWRVACRTPAAGEAEALTAALEAMGLAEEEIEVEREMLDGLQVLTALHASIAATGLPVVETGHRVVGADRCHYSAPASMPDDASQPSGRLILTSARAIFVGGARSTTVAWHAVSEVLQQDRDVVLVKHDRETFHRFRCNLFADALSAAFLATTLAASHRRRSV
jgi:hypothetical protein